MTTERWSARTESGGRIPPLVILSLAAIASPLLAQGSIPVPEAPVGSRVRVWTLYENLGEARVLEWGDSTLVLAPADAEADSLTVPFREISKLQVSWGRDMRRGIARGALFGSGAGIAIGLLVGAAAVNNCSELFCELDALGYMAGGMVIGGVIGGAVGATNPPERWVRVELPVEAGFPPYRKPFHETMGFRIASTVVGILISVAIN